MPAYNYKAITVEGSTVTGTLTASNKNEIADMLNKRQSYPVYIEEKKQFNISFGSKTKFSARDISIFCRQFYAMLNSGVNILSSLDILRVQVENKKLRELTGQIYEDVQKGNSLSGSIRRQGESFPELLINMIEAGEASGNLDEVMKRMSEHYEKEYKINNKIKNALVYPTVLAIVAILVVVFLLTFVMPTFVGMFSSSGVELPLPTRIVLGASLIMQKFWYIILLLVIGIVFLFRNYINSNKGRNWFDGLKLKLPVIKKVNEKIISSRFTRTLSTLLGSGIPLLQALENVSRIVGNVVVEKAILKIRDDVRRGMPLATPVQASGLFPPMVDNMINIGEEAGTMEDLLDKTANFYDEEVEVALQRMTTLFEPIMIVIMGIMIGFIVVAMLMPMFDMVKTVG